MCRHATNRLLDHRGFTLIELTVVVTLIGIMLVVAIPRLSGGIFADDSDEAARWFMATVRQLKEKAAVDGKTYLLTISPDTQRCWIAGPDMSEEENTMARQQGYAMPKGTVIDHVQFGEERISRGDVSIAFFAQGHSDKATIRLRDDEGQRLALVIEPFLNRVDLIRGRQGW